VADWYWEPVTDDLLDGLPPDALRAIRQLAGELTVRESMIFLDGQGFTGVPPGSQYLDLGDSRSFGASTRKAAAPEALSRGAAARAALGVADWRRCGSGSPRQAVVR
jgi:hypothetical protein